MDNFFNPNITAFKPQNTKGASLSVFYTNDMHGDLKNLARLKTAKDTFEKQNASVPKLTLSGGDMFLGTDKKRNKFLVDFMNKFTLDATTLGNHEFSAKSKGLAENLENAEFKSVCANIEVNDKNELSKRIRDKKLVKSTTFMKGGHKFGIIGAAPVDSYIGKNEQKEHPTRVMDIEKTIKAINEEAKELEKQGVNKIILCSHLGYGEDKDLKVATETEGIDIIIGGHTHTKIDGVNNDKLNLVKSKRNEPVIITQAGGMNKKAGFLNVEFDENGVIKENSIVNKLVNVKDFEPAESVNKLMEQHLGKNEILAQVKTPYIPKNNFAERILDNPLHNHFGQALLEKGKQDGARASIFGNATLRGGMNNNITTYDVKYAMLPFNSPINLVEMSEKEIVKLLNKNLGKVQKGKSIPTIYRTGGMSYTASTVPQINKDGEKIYLKEIVFDGDNTKIDVLNPSDKKIKLVVDEYTLQTNFPEKMENSKILGEEQEIFIDYLKNKKELDTNIKKTFEIV